MPITPIKHDCKFNKKTHIMLHTCGYMNHNYWIIEQKKSTSPTNSHKKIGVYTATKFYDFLSHKLAQIFTN